MIYGDFEKSSVNEKSEKQDAYGIVKLAGEVITEGMQTSLPYTIGLGCLWSERHE